MSGNQDGQPQPGAPAPEPHVKMTHEEGHREATTLESSNGGKNSGSGDHSTNLNPTSNGTTPKSHEDTEKQAVEDSLGAALAGMNLGTSAATTSTSNESSTAGVSSSFLSGGESGGTPGTEGWGSFASDIASTPSAFAGGAGSQDGTTNESLHLFLSRDPSHTLGLKLSHSNLPSLDQQGLSSGDTASAFRMEGEGTPGKASPGLRSKFGDIRRRNESPNSATNGTTNSSRSNSPYHESGHTIQAYQPFDPTPAASSSDDLSAQGYSLNQHGTTAPTLNTSLDGGLPRSPYAKAPGPASSPYATTPAGNGSMVGGYEYDRNGAAPNMFVDPSQPEQQPQPGQVLYMAVPSPDGRGRLLQPVQMVQLPGSKQMAYVVAGGPQPFEGGSSTVDGSNNAMMNMGSFGSNDPYATPGMSNGNGGVADMRRSPYAGDSMRSPYEASLGSRDEYSRGGGGAGGFQPDPAVASLYAAPQRPPLDALLGQVRRLSRDQVGCRLVQQALDEEGPMAATLILQEGLPFWGEAMVDPFGNYLFQKILEKVTPEERIMLVKSISSRLVNASLNLHGTRSVQKIVELCSVDIANGVDKPNDEEESAADILTKTLSPSAARLCIDSHGNHVIQRIILKLGPKYSDFVFGAVASSVGDVARHRHGCCVIQRCLDSQSTEARAQLVHRIVDKALELMQDAYGNYVVQYVLDVCSDEDVHAVCESVVGKVNLLAIQKFSSNVMEKCLERCTERVKEQYMAEISESDRIRELMMDPFGNYVVQRALSVATHAQAVRLVEAMKPHLLSTTTGGPNGQRNGGVRNTAGGRRIIAKICRRFPNFTLNEPGEPQDPMPHRGHDDPYNRGRGGGQRYYHGQDQMSPAHGHGMPYNAGPSYMADPRYSMGQMGMQQQQQQQQTHQQQQTYYNFGGGPYYDPFTSGGGYGM